MTTSSMSSRTSSVATQVCAYRAVILNEVEQFEQRRKKYIQCKKFMVPTHFDASDHTVSFKWYESQIQLICTLFQKLYKVYERRFKHKGVGKFQPKRRKTVESSKQSKLSPATVPWNGDLTTTNFPNGIGIDPVSILRWTPLLSAFHATGRTVGFVDLHFDTILHFQEYIYVDLFGSPTLYEMRGKTPHGGGFLREYTDFV